MEAEEKRKADQAAAAKKLDDDLAATKKQYEKKWGKSADLSPSRMVGSSWRLVGQCGGVSQGP